MRPLYGHKCAVFLFWRAAITFRIHFQSHFCIVMRQFGGGSSVPMDVEAVALSKVLKRCH